MCKSTILVYIRILGKVDIIIIIFGRHLQHWFIKILINIARINDQSFRFHKFGKALCFFRVKLIFKKRHVYLTRSHSRD